MFAIFFCSTTTNTTDWTEDQNHTSDICSFDVDWTFTFIPVSILIISVLGIVLNVFVLMVFCLHKKACTTPEIYLSNLAAADLVLVSFLPFWAIYVSNNLYWTFGQAMCKIVTMNVRMNSSCSIYFLVLVSIDRYLALVHPLSYERIRKPFFAKLGCLLVWILGFSFSVPIFINRELRQINNQTLCILNSTNKTVNNTLQSLYFVFWFIIPVFIIFFCTIKIIKVLRSRPVGGKKKKKRDQKAITIVLAVLLAFLICWGPYHLIKIPYMFPKGRIVTSCNAQIFYICQTIFTYLAFSNSILNPIIYILVGKNFRSKVKELFRQWNCESTQTFSETSTSTNLPRSGKTPDATKTANMSTEL